MCGIAGTINLGIEEDLLGALSTISHRGPDHSATVREGNVLLGMCRLAIQDLSEAGHQPMRIGKYVLVYNGEIYNFKLLREEIEEEFTGGSDTEVLLRAVIKWGLEEAISKFNGMFAFALLDTEERKLFLVRDRLGIKPLYVYRQGSALAFASELRPIKVLTDNKLSICPNGLHSLLARGYVSAPESIYQEVKKLLPGTILEVNLSTGEQSEKKYWKPGYNKKEILPDLAELNFENLLSDAVNLRMIADVPVGVFLSGGIDSSLITALMSGSSVRSFCIGFDRTEYNEAKFAKKIADHLGTEHTELYLNARDVLEVVPELASIADEPFANPALIPTTLVSRLAKEHVTVALSGTGGDELFLGYNRYFATEKLYRLMSCLPEKLRASILPEKLLRMLPVNKIDVKVDTLKRSITFESLEDLYFRVLGTEMSVGKLFKHYTERTFVLPEADTIAESLQLYDQSTYLPDDLLVMLDRATMSVSLEGRVPFLDHRVVEFANSLPREIKFRKALLKKILAKHVPPELFEREKMGFSVPIGAWLTEDLGEFAEDLLSEEALAKSEHLDAREVRKVWEAHKTGQKDYSRLLWSVLMFQLWVSSSNF